MITTELDTVWITSDSKKFLSEKEAKLHEIDLSTVEVLHDWS